VTLRVDLDGLRFRCPGEDAIYLIDQGKKRWVSGANVYNALFRNWDNVFLDDDIAAIDSGAPIDANSLLFRCVDNPSVFLLDAGKKRHVRTPAVMDRFQFDWGKIHVWNSPLASIGYPDGPEIVKEGRWT
jgi:hypothetical protein